MWCSGGCSWKCSKIVTFCSLLTRCTILCACHAKRHLNIHKWREHVVFLTFWLRNVLRATTVHTSKSGPSMVCFVHFDLEMCFAPQRRTLCHVSSGQRSHKSLEQQSVSRLSYLFTPLPCSAFHLSILSEVWLLNFLRWHTAWSEVGSDQRFSLQPSLRYPIASFCNALPCARPRIHTARTAEGSGQQIGKRDGQHRQFQDTQRQRSSKPWSGGTQHWRATWPRTTTKNPWQRSPRKLRQVWDHGFEILSWQMLNRFHHLLNLGRSLRKVSASAWSPATGFGPSEQTSRTPWIYRIYICPKPRHWSFTSNLSHNLLYRENIYKEPRPFEPFHPFKPPHSQHTAKATGWAAETPSDGQQVHWVPSHQPVRGWGKSGARHALPKSLGPADIRCGNDCGRLHGQTSRAAVRHFGRRYLVAGREEVESDQGFVQRPTPESAQDSQSYSRFVCGAWPRTAPPGVRLLVLMYLGSQMLELQTPWRFYLSRKKTNPTSKIFLFTISSPCFPLPFLACVTIRSILTLACFINPRSTIQSARPVPTQLAHQMEKWRPWCQHGFDGRSYP